MIAAITYWSHACLHSLPYLALTIWLPLAATLLLQAFLCLQKLPATSSLVSPSPSLVSAPISLVRRTIPLVRRTIPLVSAPIPLVSALIPLVRRTIPHVGRTIPQVGLVASLVEFIPHRFTTMALQLSNTIFSQRIPKTKHHER